MLSIQISDIKDFMSHLLSKDTFDHFYFIEASIKMGVSYQIQGRINEGFYDTSVEPVSYTHLNLYVALRNIPLSARLLPSQRYKSNIKDNRLALSSALHL